MFERNESEIEIRRRLEPSSDTLERVIRAALDPDRSEQHADRRPTFRISRLSLATVATIVTSIFVLLKWPSDPPVESSQFAIRGSGACITTTRLEPTARGLSIFCHNQSSTLDGSIFESRDPIALISLSNQPNQPDHPASHTPETTSPSSRNSGET